MENRWQANVAKRLAGWFTAFAVLAAASAFAASATNTVGIEPAPGLHDTTILIIRHAEKPESGSELSPAGQKRAEEYVHYFKEFKVDAQPMRPDYIFGTKDSKNSHRPRLTIEPVAKALALQVDDRFKNKNYEDLAREIRSTPHGHCILIAWHHGDIPQLAGALGADAEKLVPGGKWPDGTFDWLLELRYDHDGRLVPAQTKLIHEQLMPDDSKP